MTKYRFDKPLRTEKRIYFEEWKMLGFIPRRRARHFWVVLEEFSFLDENGELVHTVKKGFKTDFSSVPVGFRWMFPKDDVDSQAAVLHDNLYHVNKPHSVEPPLPENRRTRKDCDSLFLIGMEVCGQPFERRRLKYRGVRLGGWYGWNKKDKKVCED